MRLKALAEIYTMRSFGQLCNLNFLSKLAQNFAEFCKIREIRQQLAIYLKKSQLLDKVLAIFQERCYFRAVQRSALCRSRQELTNAYLLAKFRFDTAENEP